MSTVLLTGSTGFIGSSLINYLETNSPSSLHDILVLSSVEHPKLKTVLYDVNSLVIPELIDASTIIHLGAFTPKNNSEANHIKKCTSNIIFTQNLLNNLPKSIEKFVFISTLDVYESNNEIINEYSKVTPVSIYAWSKVYCERIVIEWCKKWNVSCKILRLGHIYGSGEDAYKKLIPETIKKIIQDIPPVIFTDGNEKRSFLHVNDCVRCIWEAFTVESDDLLINIVSGNSFSVKQLVQMLVEISGKSLFPQIQGNNIETKDYFFDNTKMVEVFGPEQVEILEGLSEEYDYFLNKAR